MNLSEMIKKRNKLAHLLTNDDNDYLDMLDEYTTLTLKMQEHMDSNINNQ